VKDFFKLIKVLESFTMLKALFFGELANLVCHT